MLVLLCGCGLGVGGRLFWVLSPEGSRADRRRAGAGGLACGGHHCGDPLGPVAWASDRGSRGMRGPAGRLWRGFPSVLSSGESLRALFCVLAAAACLGRLRTLLWSVLAVLVVPVGALTAGAGPRVGGLRRRLVAG